LLKSKPPKEKQCRICDKWFQPQSGMSPKVCGIKCAIKKAESDRKTKQKKEYKKVTKELKKKQRSNDRAYLLEKAQIACNAYIRERDKHLPCISCGTTKPDIQYCAGHYKTRGAYPELRFNELNIHKQCNKYCNLSLSGNISGYRQRLIEKIGLSAVEWLEGAQKPQKLSLDDIRDITRYYKDKLKALAM